MPSGSHAPTLFFWTLNLPWDLAAAQTGVFLGALLQEWPHEGRPSRQLPGRLLGERGRGEVSESVCSLACWLPWRVRGTLLWLRGCWGPCSQPKSSEKKTKNTKVLMWKRAEDGVERGRCKVPQTPRSQTLWGGEERQMPARKDLQRRCSVGNRHRDAVLRWMRPARQTIVAKPSPLPGGLLLSLRLIN